MIVQPAERVFVPQDFDVQEGFIAVPPEPRSQWSINDFTVLHRLGGGQYGEVSLACVKGTNFLVALKKLNIEHIVKQKVVGQLRREVEIAFHTRHKYVLRTFGYFFDSKNVYLILEACAKGMLYAELSRVKCYPPSMAARYVAQLAEALHYLHHHHVMHRDIKPENILLDHNSNIKVADFGWSVHDPNNRRKTACGTPEYFAPEIIEVRPYDSSTDLWCLGIFCYELLVGKTPFAEEPEKPLFDANGKEIPPDPKKNPHEGVMRNIRKFNLQVPASVPDDAKDLITSLLRWNGKDRLSLHKVLRHPFLVKNYYEPNDILPPAKRDREF